MDNTPESGGVDFETAPAWLRPVLKAERRVFRLASSRLPTTSDQLGDTREESNLATNDLGIESAERMVLGGNANPYLPQHVQRYVWAMQRAGQKTVIDFGCGEGYGTEMLAWAASKAIGIDISEDSVARASATFRHAEYVCADLTDTDSLPKAEIGTCFEVLEHLDDPSPVLEGIAGSVDRLLLSIPNPLIGGTHINAHHRSDRSLGQWKKMIREAAATRGERGRTAIRSFHQGPRSSPIRRGASMASGIWVLDVTFKA